MKRSTIEHEVRHRKEFIPDDNRIMASVAWIGMLLDQDECRTEDLLAARHIDPLFDKAVEEMAKRYHQ